MAQEEWDIDVDVLVVGAGGCGLVAALRAAEAGATVAVVEKQDRLAGNSMVSSGSVPAAGTRFQREAGIEDSAALYRTDLLRTSGPHQAEHLSAALSQVSAELVEWLVDVAQVPMTLITAYRHVGHSVNRLHAPPSRRGRDLMDGLMRAVERAGIPVAFGSPVTRLLDDGAGRVTGAETGGARSARSRIRAGAVMLACNGFGGNKDLLRRFCPEMAEATYFGSQGSEGEAVLWGEALGAGLANMTAYQAHGAVADPQGALVTWTVVEKGGIIVDASGRRFGNESLGYSAFAAEEARQEAPLYAVYDARIRDVTAAGQEEFAELAAYGGCVADGSLAEAAARWGMDPALLEASVTGAAAAARGETADGHGRSHWGLGPLEAPYVVTRILPALFHTQGGLTVDAQGAVLRSDGARIPGLFAGGGAAAGISGNAGGRGYSSGNGLLGALGLGYLAGWEAARTCLSAG